MKYRLYLVAMVVMTCIWEPSAAKDVHWIESWGCSAVEPFPKIPNAPIPDAPVIQGTLRYRLRVSEGGSRIELRITNEAGAMPLFIGDVSVGIADHGTTVRAGTLHSVTFSGRSSVAIPAGAPILSDPLDLRVERSADVIVSIYLPDSSVQAQGGNGIITEVVDRRDATKEEVSDDAKAVSVRPMVSALYVESDPSARTIVAFGDSITDGAQAESPQVRGWPGALAKRLAQGRGRARYAVSNEGIGGNRLLRNGMGLSAMGRFDRDVLSAPNVSEVIILEGINDIGFQGITLFDAAQPAVNAEDIIGAYRQLITRAHQHNIRVYGGTLLPFRGAFYFSEEKENIRVAVNHWIRTGGEFDAVIDFEQAIRDPVKPDRIAAKYDSGDNLHPSDAGYAAMADIISLTLFPGSQ